MHTQSYGCVCNQEQKQILRPAYPIYMGSQACGAQGDALVEVALEIARGVKVEHQIVGHQGFSRVLL
jgi:hypothetical protein